MTELRARLEKVPELLASAAERYRVPGATLAVLESEEIFETAHGVISLDTGVEATPDAVFQIGSITKVLTTTLVMQLVEQGRIELDAPARRYLPSFELGDREAAEQVTVRQLLTHSSGIDGDFFLDTGRGDDCVERFVLACAALGQLHAPGQRFSYCNAGFVILGRILEKLLGTTWDQALRSRLLDPIGADSLHTDPEQVLYYRAAIGHVLDPSSRELRVAPVPYLVRSNGPAGATPFGAARDLLRFARMHLEGGVGKDGAEVLSEASVRAMQEPQVAVPDGGMARQWGLGWMLFEWSGTRVIGHDGGTAGHNSFLRVLPGRDSAVALLTNGGNTAALYRRVMNAVLGELAGIELPPLPEPAEVAIDPARYCGTYESRSQRLIVTERDRKLSLRMIARTPPWPGAEGGLGVEAALQPISDSLFCYSLPASRFRNYVTFVGFAADGRASAIHLGGRTPPRVS